MNSQNFVRISKVIVLVCGFVTLFGIYCKVAEAQSYDNYQSAAYINQYESPANYFQNGTKDVGNLTTQVELASPMPPQAMQATNGNGGDAEAEQKKKQEAAKKKQEALAKKAASSHKILFFENDFSYLCDPAYSGCLLGDSLKKKCLPGGGWYDIGGQYRSRYHGEQNMRGLGLTGVDDAFLLHRTRVYGDFHLRPVCVFTPNSLTRKVIMKIFLRDQSR